MIVIGMGKAKHDCNISASIDGKFYYSKYERNTGIKHGCAPAEWYSNKLKSWGITIEDADLIVETSSGANQDPWKIDVLNGESFKIIDDKTIIIDHHLAHAWSNTSMSSDKKYVVVDGGGSNHNGIKYRSLTYDGIDMKRTSSYTSGKALYAISKVMGLVTKDPYSYVDAAGKAMGLKSYGEVNPEIYDKLLNMCKYGDDLSIHRVVETVLKINLDKSSENKKWLDFVATVDAVAYTVIRQYFVRLPKDEPIIYSGGCALNVTWNRKLLDEGYDLNIEPPVYDGGLSIGCLRYGHNYLNIEQPVISNFPYVQDDVCPKDTPTESTIDKVSELLASGKIVAWYQGYGELGPRALGNRSILMDPSIKNGKEIINSKVKHREWWRPFGASVKQERSLEYFDIEHSPYMLFNSYVKNSTLYSVTHVDNTCRHQTVTQEQNSVFYELLNRFETKTGLPVLLNTSLNLGGKPIASRPEEAIELLHTTELDAVCIGNELFVK
jgi:carbamoyltransferase